jgi:hypothetical protein
MRLWPHTDPVSLKKNLEELREREREEEEEEEKEESENESENERKCSG